LKLSSEFFCHTRLPSAELISWPAKAADAADL